MRRGSDLKLSRLRIAKKGYERTGYLQRTGATWRLWMCVTRNIIELDRAPLGWAAVPTDARVTEEQRDIRGTATVTLLSTGEQWWLGLSRS